MSQRPWPADVPSCHDALLALLDRAAQQQCEAWLRCVLVKRADGWLPFYTRVDLARQHDVQLPRPEHYGVARVIVERVSVSEFRRRIHAALMGSDLVIDGEVLGGLGLSLHWQHRIPYGLRFTLDSQTVRPRLLCNPRFFDVRGRHARRQTKPPNVL